MQYTIDELRHSIFQQIYEVYRIFQNFFGEEFVDLQELPSDEDIISHLNARGLASHTDTGNTVWEIPHQTKNTIKRAYSDTRAYIYVWWPRVTVTNENNRSVEIQDLYARIKINTEGKLPYENSGFEMTRTTFSEAQYVSGYVHSHLPHLYGTPYFTRPCLGTGPINNTILDLKNNYEEALWMLFCQELSLYVTVESLRGGPYIRMEYIGCTIIPIENDYSIPTRISFQDSILQIVRDFTKEYLEKGHLSLNYKDGNFVPGMSYYDYMLDVSNAFIDYFNAKGTPAQRDFLYSSNVIKKVFCANGKFYNRDVEGNNANSITENEGVRVLTFKGEDKRLHIFREADTHFEETTLLDHAVAMFILFNILKVVNYRYKNEHTNTNSSSSTCATAPTYQTVTYL